MKIVLTSLLAISATVSAWAQSGLAPERQSPGSTTFSDASNLPVEKIGADDLIGITVYDSPELTRTVRVDAAGEIRLPMLKRQVQAAGIYPSQLEHTITGALVDENVLVDPIVTVSVVEYRSRPITVVGAVKDPITFQATGTVTLLDAISRAQGLSENAGAEILVSHKQFGPGNGSVTMAQRIAVHDLLDGEDGALNLRLEGGEEVRVPEAGRIFVVGNVKKPGAFYITDGSESSVMKALALSEGLDSLSSPRAFIYRLEAGRGGRNEISIDLRKIMNRKSPDVSLLANDILYIPDASGLRASLKVLETTLGLGASLGAASIYAFH